MKHGTGAVHKNFKTGSEEYPGGRGWNLMACDILRFRAGDLMGPSGLRCSEMKAMQPTRSSGRLRWAQEPAGCTGQRGAGQECTTGLSILWANLAQDPAGNARSSELTTRLPRSGRVMHEGSAAARSSALGLHRTPTPAWEIEWHQHRAGGCPTNKHLYSHHLQISSGVTEKHL